MSTSNLRIARRFWDALNVEDQTIVLDTIQVLTDQDLEDVAADFCRRVFAKELDIDRVVAADALAPFVTFTLDELRCTATKPGWTLAMKREHADASMNAWGF